MSGISLHYGDNEDFNESQRQVQEKMQLEINQHKIHSQKKIRESTKRRILSGGELLIEEDKEQAQNNLSVANDSQAVVDRSKMSKFFTNKLLSSEYGDIPSHQI